VWFDVGLMFGLSVGFWILNGFRVVFDDWDMDLFEVMLFDECLCVFVFRWVGCIVFIYCALFVVFFVNYVFDGYSILLCIVLGMVLVVVCDEVVVVFEIDDVDE